MMARMGGDTDSQEAAAAMSDEAMQAMMKEYEEMGKRPDFQQVIDNVMKQLLTKDIMAEPVAEITQRFPVWLADNRCGNAARAFVSSRAQPLVFVAGAN